MLAAVVQARMSSERLPGKALLPLAGRPLLAYVLDGLDRASTPDLVVVATSADASDDPIAFFCADRGVACHRGPLDDVSARFGEVVEAYRLDAFVRLSGDSPLLDHRLVDRVVDLFRDGGCDVATNVFPRSFPPGQSVEVIAAEPFRAALAEIRDAADREHVTPFLYRHAGRYAIRNLAAPADWTGVRLAVDTPDDLARIAAMLARMDRPHWDYACEELVRLADAA